MRRRLLLLYFVLYLILKNEAARILAVFPQPSISHQVVFRRLTHELAKRGHEVVVITTDPAFPKGQSPQNLTEIDVHDISYKAWRRDIAAIKYGEKEGIGQQLKDFLKISLDLFEEQTKIPEIQDIIANKSGTFDLLLLEAWPRYALGYSHVVKAPVIIVSSFGSCFDHNDVIGAPTHPFLYPQSITTRINNLSLWEKVQQSYSLYGIMDQYYNHLENENAVVRRIFGNDAPSLSELQKNVEMMFLNIHPIWDTNRPVPPGVVYMGGLHQNPQKELPQELKSYLDSSKHGVIYISFGTNVDAKFLPPEKIQAIVNAVSNLPYDVLWKWNHDELPGRTDNIRIAKWFPQSDLLRHPNIKLFITQGGLQSTDESITAGVPLIGVPMMADQWYNAEKYVHLKIGTYFEVHNLEERSLKNAIETVIGDKSYRENVVRLRSIMNDQPMSPLDRTVWWTEHLLRHGGARHLRSPAAHMSWTQYYEINLVLFVLSNAMAVIILSLLLVFIIVRLVLKQFSAGAKIKSS